MAIAHPLMGRGLGTLICCVFGRQAHIILLIMKKLFLLSSVVSSIRSLFIGHPEKHVLPVVFQETLLRMATNSKLQAKDRPPLYYISCVDDEKGLANACAKLLEDYGVNCLMPDDFELGVNIDTFRKKGIEDADKCLLLISSQYLKQLEKVDSNVSREFRVIYRNLSLFPDSTKVVPVFLGNSPLGIPDCLRNRQGISLPPPKAANWAAPLVRLFARLIIDFTYQFIIH
jgi:hypothetical protein